MSGPGGLTWTGWRPVSGGPVSEASSCGACGAPAAGATALGAAIAQRISASSTCAGPMAWCCWPSASTCVRSRTYQTFGVNRSARQVPRRPDRRGAPAMP